MKLFETADIPYSITSVRMPASSTSRQLPVLVPALLHMQVEKLDELVQPPAATSPAPA